MIKMVFIATPEKDFELWDFITGDFYKDMSISVSRYYYLYDLNSEYELKLAFHDPITDKWTKWGSFPGLLWKVDKNKYGVSASYLTAAVDVHRNLLPNEIVIESDYPTYKQNYESAKIIGQIIEEKGFVPHYYFSGNKSVHIHIFFDWNCLKNVELVLQDRLKTHFKASKNAFKKKFIMWLRKKMISCWDTNARKFDEDLIRATHLIRVELSKNKIGYKTFLGYTHRDLSFVPYICNEKNRIYPKLGKIRLSCPESIQDIVVEFLEDLEKEKKSKKKAKSYNLDQWFDKNAPKRLRGCVGLILDEDFKKINDGFKRSMFILLNELKIVFGPEQSKIIMNDWNNRMGNPIKDEDIEYRLKQKTYKLSCRYIHSFLKGLGIDVSKKCKHKI